MDPPVSVPMAKPTSPAAVAEPEPAEEPSVAAEPSAGMNIGLIIALAVGAIVILGGLAYFFVPGIRKRNSA